jgi:hypothetical protein
MTPGRRRWLRGTPPNPAARELNESLQRIQTGNERYDLLYLRVTAELATFASRRKTVKRRATYAALATTGGTGVTTLLLGLRETFGGSETTIVTTAFVLSTGGTLVAVWDRLFNHSALWVQRTIVVNALQRLQFDMAMYATGRSAADIEDEAIDRFSAELSRIDAGDLDSWLVIRSDTATIDSIDPRSVGRPVRRR